jgi:hypothetical protein
MLEGQDGLLLLLPRLFLLLRAFEYLERQVQAALHYFALQLPKDQKAQTCLMADEIPAEVLLLDHSPGG